ncbi:MAG: signal peptidase I [Myxococcota bacterium]
MWRWLFWIALVVGVVIGIARAFAIRWWRVPSNDPYLEASIAPTLRGGDLIILWRASPPHSGDLVLCPEPKKPERVVIGRIAAQEGESIEVDGATAHLNGRRLQVEQTCLEDRFTTLDPQTRIPVEQRCELEQIGSRLHQRGEIKETPPQKVSYPEVPAGHLFLLSDNRQFPYDSRDFGPVERKTCKETVVFRLVSKAGFSDVKNRLMFVH